MYEPSVGAQLRISGRCRSILFHADTRTRPDSHIHPNPCPALQRSSINTKTAAATATGLEGSLRTGHSAGRSSRRRSRHGRARRSAAGRAAAAPAGASNPGCGARRRHDGPPACAVQRAGDQGTGQARLQARKQATSRAGGVSPAQAHHQARRHHHRPGELRRRHRRLCRGAGREGMDMLRSGS